MVYRREAGPVDHVKVWETLPVRVSGPRPFVGEHFTLRFFLFNGSDLIELVVCRCVSLQSGSAPARLQTGAQSTSLLKSS